MECSYEICNSYRWLVSCKESSSHRYASCKRRSRLRMGCSACGSANNQQRFAHQRGEAMPIIKGHIKKGRVVNVTVPDNCEGRDFWLTLQPLAVDRDALLSELQDRFR